jgi:HlyD family secretion protein
MTKKRKRLIAIISLVIVGAVVAGAVLSNRPERTLVQTGKVERVPLLESVVTASGEIRAKEFVDLQTEIAGVIVELPVREGDRVEAGDVLLRIDPFQARQDVASAQAQYDAALADESSALLQVTMGEAAVARDEFTVKAAQSDLVRAESNRDLLKRQFDRRKKLADQELITTDEYESTESALRVAESEVAAAAARVDQAGAERDLTSVTIDQWRKQHEAAGRRCAVARADLERMQDLLTKTTIASPLGGVITKLNVSKGERAVPGILSNPEATLMTIADLSTIEAEMKVDETDIIMVSLGDRALVTVDALPDVELEGRLTELGNSPIGDTGELRASSTNQEGKDFKVVVRIDDPPATLRPGLTANADIFVEKRENALVIPLQAVTMREVRVDAAGKYIPPDTAELERLERGEEGGDGAPKAAADAPAAPDEPMEELEGVFLREGDRVRFRPVELGIKGEADVEVIAGLAAGDEIVTGSYKVLRTMKEWDLIEVEEGVANTVARSKAGRRR